MTRDNKDAFDLSNLNNGKVFPTRRHFFAFNRRKSSLDVELLILVWWRFKECYTTSKEETIEWKYRAKLYLPTHDKSIERAGRLPKFNVTLSRKNEMNSREKREIVAPIIRKMIANFSFCHSLLELRRGVICFCLTLSKCFSCHTSVLTNLCSLSFRLKL